MQAKNFDVKNVSLAADGEKRIEWAGNHMPVLQLLQDRFKKEKPLNNVRLGACLHITAETANLLITLQAGGAEVFACASNPLSTQDDVAAALVKEHKIPVYAIKGEDNDTYYKHLQAVLAAKPNVTMDDGADLVTLIHKKMTVEQKEKQYFLKNALKERWEFFGSSEETTTGVIRLKAMAQDKALKIPVIAVNDSDTKHLFDNRYGTGQSTIDGILRATNVLLAGKVFVVVGYGWCGRGLSVRAKGMGADVIVCEVNPVRALEAVMDGFRVMPIKKALALADIVVTVTGDKHVLDGDHFAVLKPGAIIANSGHFNVEINLEALEKITKSKRELRPFVVEHLLKDGRKVYVLGEGRLVNLVTAEGHAPDVMDMSFANQALAAEWFVAHKGQLKPQVYTIPEKMDQRIALLKLQSMGVKIDRLTREQKHYLNSWEEGTE